MPTQFGLRTYRRFAVRCFLHYVGERFHAKGTVWNLSQNGWRVDGDQPVQSGSTLALCVYLPGQEKPVKVDQTRVSWSRGQEFGLEVIGIQAEEALRLQEFVASLVQQTLSANNAA
ncbi:MAG: PilZ domain-containing protein [Nitrospiraceae bacterium]